MKRVLSIAVMVLFIGNGLSYADEIGVLLERLVEKGVLTAGEAQEIRTETQEEIKKDLVKGKLIGLPKWIQTMGLNGDLRLRYQRTDQMNGDDRHRGRIRLRLGANAKVYDNVKVAFGFATGSTTDPRSTNQTLQDSFSMKNVVLDYAYAEYTPFDWMKLTAGKIKNAVWEPSDLLWDSDINPEGLAVNLSNKFDSGLELFCNTGFYILDESGGDTSDPFMFFIQPGILWQNDKITVKTGLALYDFTHVEGSVLDYNSGTNTKTDDAVLRYNYTSLSPAIEIGFRDPFPHVPYFGIFAEQVHCFDPSSRNNGGMIGMKLGSEKVSEKGQWQFKYMFGRLDRDAWVDVFPDSDRYSGNTNMDGHEVILEYCLAKNITLAGDYYYTQKRDNSDDSPEHIFQFDVNFKF